MKVKITESQRYADPGGPHLPQIDFVEGTTVDVCEELYDSLIFNSHGVAVDEDVPEIPAVEPESKENGLGVDSKDDESDDESDDENSTEAYDNLSPKKQLFVTQYFVDRDETQAAIRAGYSENTAETRGVALLEDEDIAAAIAERSE